LFFRLSVVPITMPALRERKEDIPLLVSAFLKQFAEENNQEPRELTPEAMEALLRYDWPGNVRELRGAIEHGGAFSKGQKIGLRELPLKVREGGVSGAASKFVPARGGRFNLHETEHRLILQALEETNHNVTQAAKRLGISRRTLHRKINEMKAHGDGV
jgi:DNA-binding NtrC family response regulator